MTTPFKNDNGSLALAHETESATHDTRLTGKATRKEVTQRIYQVSQYLAQRIPKHKIKKLLSTKYGIGARQAENYLAWAREYSLEQSQRPREDHVSDALSLYERIIRNPDSTQREQMDAQAAIRQMLGLDQPTKIAPTTPDGESTLVPQHVISQLTTEELRALSELRAKILAAMKARRLPGPNG
jgi:hypothetical protein